MANFPITNVLGPYIDASATDQFTDVGAGFADADVGSHAFAVSERGVFFMVRNTSATTSATITMPSAALFGRTAAISETVAAGQTLVRKFVPVGWETSSGSRLVDFTIASNGCEVLVLGL